MHKTRAFKIIDLNIRTDYVRGYGSCDDRTIVGTAEIAFDKYDRTTVPLTPSQLQQVLEFISDTMEFPAMPDGLAEVGNIIVGLTPIEDSEPPKDEVS